MTHCVTSSAAYGTSLCVTAQVPGDLFGDTERVPARARAAARPDRGLDSVRLVHVLVCVTA